MAVTPLKTKKLFIIYWENFITAVFCYPPHTPGFLCGEAYEKNPNPTYIIYTITSLYTCWFS